MSINYRSILAASFGCIVLLTACDDDPTKPITGKRTATAIAGAAITDTIDAVLAQPLTVEVRDSSGSPVRGIVVRFEVQAHTDTVRRNDRAIYICAITAASCRIPDALVSSTTDSLGLAKVGIRFGRWAGKGVVRYTVPEYGIVDSSAFTVNPGIAQSLRVAPDTNVEIGSTLALRGVMLDRASNVRPDAVTAAAAAGAIIAFDANTRLVTGRDFGTQWVISRSGTFVDSTNVIVVPPGRLAVAVSGSAVRMINTDGHSSRTFATGMFTNLGTFPRFDPSKQRLTFFGSLQPGFPLIGIIDTAGTSRREIDLAIELNSILSVRLMSDGGVLVVAQRNSVQAYSLWRIAADNAVKELAQLPGLRSIAGGADISPDGSRVAFVAPAGLGTPELRIIDIATGIYKAFDPNAAAPRWSPQGNRLVYLAADTVPTVINADGTGKRVLSTTPFSMSGPPGLAWSPDEKYLIGAAPGAIGLRFLRLSDDVSVTARYRNAAGVLETYSQPDWR